MEVKVTAGRQVDEGIQVDANRSLLTVFTHCGSKTAPFHMTGVPRADFLKSF